MQLSLRFATAWFINMRRRLKAAKESSMWWTFAPTWHGNIELWIKDFCDIKARKSLFEVLKALRLKISPHKTRMGALKQGFHFLGVNFEVARTPQGKIQETKVTIHPRSCRRALDNVVALRSDAVNPANIQGYLSRWAIWWKSVVGVDRLMMFVSWVRYTSTTKQADLAWVGRGLLISTVFYQQCFSTFSTNKN